MYLATAPKSNSTKAYFSAAAAVKQQPGLAIPLHLRNAPTDFMKGQGFGAGYQYDHDAPDHFSGQECLPDELRGQEFYQPGEFGYERDIHRRLEWWQKMRRERGCRRCG